MPTRQPITEHKLFRLFVGVPAVLGVCYFALWACAPVLSNPSPVPMSASNPHEVGAAIAVSGGALNDNSSPTGADIGPQLQLWYQTRVGPRFDAYVTGYAGVTNALGVGAGFRGRIIDKPGFNLALSINAGWVYATASLPISVHLGKGIWLYTEPTGGAFVNEVARFPLGVSIQTSETTRISLQGGVGLETPYASDGIPHIFGGVAFSARPGRKKMDKAPAPEPNTPLLIDPDL